MNRTFCLIATVTLLIAALPAAAQMSDTDYLQQLRADIQADRQALVAANMGLTDEEGEAFWPVYRDYRNDMAKTGDRMQKLIQDYAEVWNTATEDEAKKMLDEMLAIQHDELKVKKAHLSNFRKVLSEVQVARLYQIENKIDAAIRVELASGISLIESQ